MSTTDQRQGALFAGRYRLERKLGSGGMADVWLAEDQELGRKVAVKILHERYANDDQFVERFRREATHAASLSHPNIVSIFDRGEASGSYFIVMEYVEGRTLKELIVSRGSCPVPVAITYVRQVLAGLRFAHRAGIVHRDVKPHNVIVDSEGRVKVMDFGIARAGTSQMTEVGSIIGTAQYLSPEQARGAPVDESSDLYSTGILLYELLTGAVPFNGETPVEVAMKHLSQVPEPPSRLRPEVPHDLDLVVIRALAKEPAERYRSAQEMDRDLERVTRGEGVDRETEDAATMVMRGETTAATMVGGRAAAGYGGDERYRAYDGEVRKSRSWWPWLLALGLALAIGVGGFLLYDNVSGRLDASKTIAVDNYTGLLESKAVALIIEDGFEDRVRRVPNSEVAEGYVIEQEPAPGTRLQKGSIVTIDVSTGRPEVTVPPLIGKTRDEAVRDLTALDLEVSVVEVNSEQEPGIVTAQDPAAGTVLITGSTVRVNVSKGIKQVAVPSVVGQQVDIASSQLQLSGFKVGRVDVESEQPAGEVVTQSPAGNSTAPKGSSVTLSVSKGPTTVEVPDVTLQPIADARTTLVAAGFKVQVIREETDDLTLDGYVLNQNPAGSTQADPGTIVTVTVGSFVEPVTTDPIDTTADTTTFPVTRIRVAVLAGGRSSEHDISVASAQSVVEALDPERYVTTTIAIGRDGRWELPAATAPAQLGAGAAGSLPVPTTGSPQALGEVDVVLPILHGPFGEDGTVQGLLELAGVPYVGSGVTASALCMDKDLFKAVLRDRGIPVAANVTLRAGDEIENPYGYPVFVKPARLGSSVGISKVASADGLEAAVALARRHDDKVLIEEFQPGLEVECGVLGNRGPIASVVGEIVAHADWYDYEAKYAEGGMELVIPARLDAETSERVRALAVEAFVATDCEGMARIDFFVRPDGEVVVNELNTIPGFTATSVYAKLFAASGVPYDALLDRLIELAVERHERRSLLEY